MSNPGRKSIARSLREQGLYEAALAVLLDYTPVAGESDEPTATAPAAPDAPVTLTHAQLKAMSAEQVTELRTKQPEVYRRSLAATRETAAAV